MSKALRYITGAALIAVGVLTSWSGGSALIVAGVSMIVGAALEKTPRKLRRLQEQSVMVRSAVAPQEIVYGRTKKSGVVVWYDANGSKNKYLWFVIAVCEHEIDGYEKLWIDSVEVDIATEIDVDGYVTKSDFIDSDNNKLVKTGFYTGTDSQTADADLVASTGYWTTDHRGRGVSYFWVRLEIDSSKGGTDPEQPGVNVWSKGYPRDVSVVIRGAKIYDPRKDSTQTAIPGSGSHRVDTPSTWEWSNNSVLVRADYIRHDRFGPGYSSSDIDWVTVAEQADIADENVSVPDGLGGTTTQKNHTIDGIVSTDDQPKTIIESLQSADHGTTLFNPGEIKIYAGAWQAPTHTITSDWLAGTYSATSSVPADNAYNAVRGQYLSADEGYALIGFQPVTSGAYETEDGVGRQWSDITLSYTTDEYRAQRLAIIELKKSRLQTSMTLECGPIAEQVDVHDTVTVDLLGYSSESSPSGVKTFRVTSKSSTTDGITSLTLKEEQESDWTYDVADLATPPVVPSVARGDGVLDPPTSLTATTAVNGIILDWVEPADIANVDYYELWVSATNDRTAATLLARTTQTTYLQRLAEGVERYYWVRSMSDIGYTSVFEPVSATGGVYGIAGEQGADAILYYIKPTAGTAIKNNNGELTVEAHLVTGGVDIHLNSGTIKLYVGDGASPEVFTEVTVANGYATGSDGYTGVFDSGDITGAVTVYLKDGASGETLDTITLVDVADGRTNYAGAYADGATSPALTGVTNATDSWDTAEAWVGNQSLKIIATGTDAAVYLGSGATDYNINIPAGRKWVYSFYVKLLSTNSPLTTDNVDGFVRKSSDGGFENIGIQNVPADGAWHRVYGTIDLTGDTSTSVLMRVDNDSYNSANTTMYIDGLQLELDSGSGLPTDWRPATAGTDGTDGTDAVYGYIQVYDTRAWVREIDQTTFDPADTYTDADITFVQGGADVARGRVRVSRDSDGLLTASALSVYTHASGDLNISRITRTIIGSGTKTLSLVFDYSFGGFESKVSETFIVTLSGEGGIGAALTNSNPAISVDIEGYNYPLTGTTTKTVVGTTGSFEVHQGTSDLTGLINDMYAQDSSVGWNVAGSTEHTYTDSGLTLKINIDTGEYYCIVQNDSTAYRNWTDDVFTAPIRAAVDGSYHTRQFTATKNRTSYSKSVDLRIKSGNSFSAEHTGTSSGIEYIVGTSGSISTQVWRNGSTYLSATNEGTWLNSGTNSEYDIRGTLVTGDGSVVTGASLGSWLSLASTRKWKVTDDTVGTIAEGYGPEVVIIEFDIRRNSTSEVLTTQTVTLSAYRNVSIA